MFATSRAKAAATTEMAKLGDLRLPDPKSTDFESITINGVRVSAGFGDVFSPSSADMANMEEKNLTWVPVVPYYCSGSVYTQWVELGGCPGYGHPDIRSEEADGRILVVLARPPSAADTAAPQSAQGAQGAQGAQSAQSAQSAQEAANNAKLSERIEVGVLYSYDQISHNLDNDIRLIAKNLELGSILVFPAIGTNNGLSYYESAARMFYSVVACLACSPPNEAHGLSEVRFTCPFNHVDAVTTADHTPTAAYKFGGHQFGQGQGGREHFKGVRTVQHIMNLIRVYKDTADEPECDICANLRADTMFHCGHRFCWRCARSVTSEYSEHKRRCPMCKAPVQSAGCYPCYKIVNCSSFVCCKYSAAAATAAATTTANDTAITPTAAPDAVATATDQKEKEKEPTQKAKFIFTPCGHYSALCSDCHDSYLLGHGRGSPKECPVCKESAMAYIRFYC